MSQIEKRQDIGKCGFGVATGYGGTGLRWYLFDLERVLPKTWSRL